MLAAAQAATVSEGDEIVQWGLVQSNRNPFDFVASRTAPLIDTTTDPPTAQIDRPEVADALQWYVDLFLLHEVAPNLEPPVPDEDGVFIPPEYELIENGMAAMWPEYSGSWQWRTQQMNVGVVPFPVDAPDDQTTPVYVNGYVLSAGTRYPEAAWRWINFISQQPSVDSFSQDTAVPARRSVAEADGFWDRVDPELGEALRYAVDHSYFYRYGAGYGAFYEAANAVLTENESVADALTAAQVQAEADIADFAAEQDGVEDVEIVITEQEDTAVPEGAVTIVFTASSGVNGLQPYRDLAAAFQEQHPDVVIELETPNFGTSAINLADVAANSDCLQWYGGINSEEEQAAVLNLEPFLDADPDLGKADFYPQAIDAFSYQGQLWGLPAEMNVFLIVYNKALFDEAGLPYPQLDWTTDDFLETAVALTTGDDPETEQYGYVPQEFELNDLSAFLERLGAQFLDESVDPPQLAFTHPDTIEAVRWYTNLTTEFAVKPTFTTNVGTGSAGVGEERKSLIENGRAAMWSDQGFQSFPEINFDDLDLGVVPLPARPDGTATAASAITGYFISSGTEHRQVCWDWIKFLDEQPSFGSYGNTIPAQSRVAISDAYAQAVGAEKAAANLASIENITGPSASLRLSTDASWLSLGHFWWQSYAYDQILTAGIPVKEALTAVQAKADAYRDCVVDRDGLEDQNIQLTCLGEIDDTVPPFFLDLNE